MRLFEVISMADSLKPNRFTLFQKAEWVNALQEKIYDMTVKGRKTESNFEKETKILDGRTEIDITFIESGNRIVLSEGPQSGIYDVVGQRVLAGNDYHIVTDSDIFSDLSHIYWRITVNGTVPSGSDKLYPALEIFKKNTDELMLGHENKDLYVYWLLAKIDFFNRETIGYNNSSLVFNELFDSYVSSVMRSTRLLSDTKIKYTV